ncbi:hypothetical protein JW933_03025 [candidate division FCPU426 bacterium]|nr:hypothetical protein [candidate division FCPU426 bacterium]
MTQLEMGISADRPYGVQDIPGALVKGLNRKRVQDRRPRQLPRPRKKAGNTAGPAGALPLW